MIAPEIKAEISAALKKHSPKRVLLQAPEGLKTEVREMAETIEKRGAQVVIWADPCFGACDIPCSAAEALGCDLIVHVGHAPMGVKSEIPTEYIEYRTPQDFAKIIGNNIGIFAGLKTIGIATTLQHVQDIAAAKECLEKNGIQVLTGKSAALKYAGQVLGCDAGAAKSIEDKVDAFLFLGSGRFHAIGVLKKVSKPVFACDFEINGICNMANEKELIEKRKALRAANFDATKNIGILVSTKKGQMPKKDIFALKKKLEARGKDVKIVAMDYISPEKILGMNFGALINCACPRIEDDVVFRETVVGIDETEGVF